MAPQSSSAGIRGDPWGSPDPPESADPPEVRLGLQLATPLHSRRGPGWREFKTNSLKSIYQYTLHQHFDISIDRYIHIYISIDIYIYPHSMSIYQYINISLYQHITTLYQYIIISIYKHMTYIHINISLYPYINISLYQYINISI